MTLVCLVQCDPVILKDLRLVLLRDFEKPFFASLRNFFLTIRGMKFNQELPPHWAINIIQKLCILSGMKLMSKITAF